MSVNQKKPQEINHSTYELKFLKFEAAVVKKHEEMIKTIEGLSMQLNEMKINQVIIFFL